MLIYPQIDPIAFSIGPLQIHWYGLMYLLGFGLAWALAHWRTKHYGLPWTSDQISDLIFYAALGVIVGGRIGYMLFYSSNVWMTKPWVVLKIWEGGMSFHGGLVGVAIVLWVYARQINKPYLEVGDFLAPLVPLGLGAGRLGNFINGELWGRPTDVSWGMLFPNAGDIPRHPSQLYELGLEGIALFILVWCYASKPRPAGCVSGVFLMGYAMSRLVVERFREPDPQLGFLAFQSLTMGQMLSIPMLLVGLYIWGKNRNTGVIVSQ